MPWNSFWMALRQSSCLIGLGWCHASWNIVGTSTLDSVPPISARTDSTALLKFIVKDSAIMYTISTSFAKFEYKPFNLFRSRFGGLLGCSGCVTRSSNVTWLCVTCGWICWSVCQCHVVLLVLHCHLYWKLGWGRLFCWNTSLPDFSRNCWY